MSLAIFHRGWGVPGWGGVAWRCDARGTQEARNWITTDASRQRTARLSLSHLYQVKSLIFHAFILYIHLTLYVWLKTCAALFLRSEKRYSPRVSICSRPMIISTTTRVNIPFLTRKKKEYVFLRDSCDPLCCRAWPELDPLRWGAALPYAAMQCATAQPRLSGAVCAAEPSIKGRSVVNNSSNNAVPGAPRQAPRLTECTRSAHTQGDCSAS